MTLYDDFRHMGSLEAQAYDENRHMASPRVNLRPQTLKFVQPLLSYELHPKPLTY